jgi:hypothetical protein
LCWVSWCRHTQSSSNPHLFCHNFFVMNCHYSESRYAECRGAIQQTFIDYMSVVHAIPSWVKMFFPLFRTIKRALYETVCITFLIATLSFHFVCDLISPVKADLDFWFQWTISDQANVFYKSRKIVLFWQTHKLNTKSVSEIGSLNRPLE